MCKKLAFYPMTRDTCAAARHLSLMQGYILTQLFVPAYMKLNRMDISSIDGGNFSSVSLTEYNKELISDLDTLFLEYDENIDDLSLYLEVVSDAEEMGKEIILSRQLSEKINKKTITWPEDKPFVENPETDRLLDVQVPVVTVLSQGMYTDQFATELALRKNFLDAGYKVSQIGSREISRFFGFQSIPDFIYEHRDSYDLILRFNRYVKEIVDSELPELLIIGVPGAIMKFNDRLLNGLGVLPFVISNAVRSDVSVMCMNFNQYKKETFEEMFMFGQYRLDSLIQFINIANTSASPDVYMDNLKLNFTDLDSEFVLQNIQQSMECGNYHVFNALDSESALNACIAIQDKLADNARYMR